VDGRLPNVVCLLIGLINYLDKDEVRKGTSQRKLLAIDDAIDVSHPRDNNLDSRIEQNRVDHQAIGKNIQVVLYIHAFIIFNNLNLLFFHSPCLLNNQ